MAKKMINVLLLNLIIIPPILTEDNDISLNYTNIINEISMTIGRNLKILNEKFYPIPFQVIFNGKEANIQDNIIISKGLSIYVQNQIIIRWNRTIKDCSLMFYNVTTVNTINLTNFDLSLVTSTAMMFGNCNNLKKIIFPNNRSYTSIKDMNNMFYKCISLNNINIENMNTYNVYNMSYLFYECNILSLLNLTNFDTSNVLDMRYMFYNCKNIKILNLSLFNTSKVFNMNSIFGGCFSISSLDLSGFQFINTPLSNDIFSNLTNLQYLNFSNINIYNGYNNITSKLFANNKKLIHLNISNFRTYSKINLEYMFYNLNSLNYLDMSNFQANNSLNMSCMFFQCSNLKTLNLSNFESSLVYDMSNIFKGTSLVTLDLSNFIFNNNYKMNNIFQTIISFNGINPLQKIILNNVTIYNDNISCLFKNLQRLNTIELSNFKADSIIDMSYLFSNCYNLISLNLSSFKMEKVKNISCMFQYCQKLISLDLSFMKTSNVENMYNIFYSCNTLRFLDLSGWDFNNVKHDINIFSGLSNIQNISLKNCNFSFVNSLSKLFYNLQNLLFVDLSNSDASSVINMDHIFQDCHRLIAINLSNLITFNVESMEGIFYDCYQIKEIDLSEINAKNVKNMKVMFAYCINLISLNLTNFETENIEDMSSMFYGCTSIKSLNLSQLKTSKVKNMIGLFYNCKSLISIDYSNFDFTSITHSPQIFDNKGSLQYIKASNVNISKFNDISNLFYGFSSLQYLDFSQFDASSAIYMKNIFAECTNLISLNLNSIKINKMQNMEYAFSKCNKLVSLNISNINVSFVTNMRNMFQYCNELTYIDLSQLNLKGNIYAFDMFYECGKLKEINFINENNTFYFSHLGYMFYNCKELKSLDLTNFNTDNATDASYMFNGCIKLETINLSSFNTKNITNMNYMFFNCQNLKSLDLSNFRTKNLRYIDKIFNGCNSLIYLDLSNWEFNYVSFSKEVFNNLISLKYLKLSYVKTKFTSMANVFSYLKYIISLDLSNFYTNNVYCMNHMFYSSDKLKFLNLTNINTSLVSTMNNMFSGCTSLTSLDLSSFNTSKVNNLQNTFYNLNSLTYIKLNFNLKSLSSYSNSFFGTKNFEYCIIDETSMIILYDIIKSLPNTKRDCSKRCYSDERILNNDTNKCFLYSDENRVIKYFYNYNYYDECPPKTYLAEFYNYTYICKDLYCDKYYDFYQINCIDIIPEGYYLNDTYNKTIDKCHPNCKECDKKETINNTNCKLCFSDKFLYYGNCIDKCPNGYYLYQNDTSSKICKCINSSCLTCPLNNTDLCYSCNEPDYYQIYNDITNIFPYVNCYQNPEGYYLDKINNIYKPCYKTCKTCSDFSDLMNNNCLECAQNHSKKTDFINDSNCYINCDFYYYFDYNKNYFCTNGTKCPSIFNKIIEEKSKCIDSCEKDDKYKYEFRKKCYENCPDNTRNNNYYCEIKCPIDFPYEIIETQECVNNCTLEDLDKGICILNNKIGKENIEQDEISKNIQESLINGDLDTSKIDSGEDIVIKSKDTSFTITNTENQKNSYKKNISTINLGECETKIKSHYNISQNDSLYIFKIDVLKEGMKIPKIEYEVYYPFNGKNLEKLSLTYCEDTKIELLLPVSINLDDLEKHNSSSSYYNDICYISTSNNGIDITLNDRKNKFINNNLTICEEDCYLTGYDPITQKASCSCDVKISLPEISGVNIDTQKLKNKFIDIKNIANLDLMKCFDTLFSKLGLNNNYGFLILLGMILAFIICMFLYYLKEQKNFKNIIKIIILYKINTNKYIEENFKKNKKDKSSTGNLILVNKEVSIKESRKKKDFLKSKKTKLKFISNDELKNIMNIFNIHSTYKQNKKQNHSNPPIKKNKKINKRKSKITKNILKNHKIFQTINNNNLFKVEDLNGKVKYMKKYENLLKMTDSELCDLDYKDAIKIDKRTYCQFYLSLVKSKHLISFTFFPLIDYNSRIIKISLFILSSTIDLFVNALFFNDSTMHQIYEDNGSFNFIYQLPQILYSFLISELLNIIIQSLALTENYILKIKHAIKIDRLFRLEKSILKIIFYKSIFYFLTSYLILLFCWYYLSCFCCIYKNTQFHLFKDTILGFIMSLLYPFITNLIPGIFRIPALRAPKKNRKTMYIFSKIIQII